MLSNQIYFFKPFKDQILQADSFGAQQIGAICKLIDSYCMNATDFHFATIFLADFNVKSGMLIWKLQSVL